MNTTMKKALIAHDHASNGRTRPGSPAYNFALLVRDGAIDEYSVEKYGDLYESSHGGGKAWRDFWQAVEDTEYA